MSVIPFVAADGTVLMIAHVLPFGRGEKMKKKRSICHPIYKYQKNDPALYRSYIFTESGWVTKESWIKILDHFLKITKSYFNGQVCMMLLDRLIFHMNVEQLKKTIQCQCAYSILSH